MASINIELNLDGGITGRLTVQSTETPTNNTSMVEAMRSSMASLLDPLRQLLDRLPQVTGAVTYGPLPQPPAQGNNGQTSNTNNNNNNNNKNNNTNTSKTPELDKKLEDWTNFTKSVDKLSAGWLDGLSNKMTELILKGKVKFTDFFRSITTDLIKAGTNSILGNAFTWIKNLVAHTGGIIGVDPLPSRGALFATAQRFHEGGFPGLQSDEVPAILRRGEGVFTPEQMKALGGVGSQQINQTVNITVAGSAGTPEQNRDLADQIGRQLHDEMRGLVLQELRREMRPGGMLRS